MKISLFAHMERNDPNQSYVELYAQFLELCEMADRGGFSGIWVGEHHGMDFTIAPNPFAQLCDLANRTSNLRLGTATIVAPFWHPIKLAGEIAMVDIITGGRLEVSISRGAYEFEYERLSPGLDAWTAGEMLREIVPAIKEIWKGDYAHDGKHWKFPAVTSVPAPMQDPHPPLWIAARNPDSHDFAVASQCNVQVTPLWQNDGEVADLMDKFNTAVTNNPNVPRPKIMVLRHTFVGANEADLSRAAEKLSEYYCVFGAWFKNSRPVHNGRIDPLSAEERAQIEMFSPDNMRANNIVGSPDRVIERLKHYESLGYDEYAFWIDTGMSHDTKKKSLQLFIDEVLPEFS
ncbi:LLM class flavin-dependent oxidoreductase [Candidatus Spongiihabitans sp.]|uniref:LLM class flavin-dependent oxidoreductase n=1 Tax=Candidatus Spongiihabitans sp. TaxID=3101308 RepID=UPI003C6EB9A1